MTPDKIIATRKAIGLSQAEFARTADVIKGEQAAQEVKSLLVGAVLAWE